MDDADIMRKVIQLAKRGAGMVSPNPLVGAILVRDGRILSNGYHVFFGGPHAEINAFSKLTSEEIKNSTLYVNLEPCDHHGKTPPCTESIVRHGIRRVVIGTKDPNPLVSGKGIMRLQSEGIRVDEGILENECREINRPYFKFMVEKSPFVTVKIAQTLDGKIALPDGESRWISCEESRKFVQKLRLEADAVVVGVNTIIKDDPFLTVHRKTKHVLKRIVLDTRLRTPQKSRVLSHADIENTIFATTEKAPSKKIQDMIDRGARVWTLPSTSDKTINLQSLLKKIAEENIVSILVEGGSRVFTSFMRHKQIDRLIVFLSPKIFGKGVDVFQDLNVSDIRSSISLEYVRWIKSGKDIVLLANLT